MDPVLIGGLAKVAGGIVGAATQSAPTSLEAELKAAVSNNWGSSFSVGTGSTANSSPSLSSGSGLGSIPKEYLIAGGIIAAALGLAAILK